MRLAAEAEVGLNTVHGRVGRRFLDLAQAKHSTSARKREDLEGGIRAASERENDKERKKKSHVLWCKVQKLG